MHLKKITACLISGSLFWNSAHAGISHTSSPNRVEINAEELLLHSSNLRGELANGLNDERVLKELNRLGIEKSEVQMRVAAMSDQELLQVQQGVQRQAGGDVIVLSLTTLLIIIIAILLLR